MDNLIIQRANISDLEKVLFLSDGLTLADFPYDKKVDINWAHTDKGRKYYEEKIKGTLGICFVAEIDEKIIGFITAAEKKVPSYRQVKVAELENIFVKEEFRNKGIGKKLMEAFVNWAKELKVDKVAVNVFALNEKAIAFYKREGFVSQDLNLEKYL